MCLIGNTCNEAGWPLIEPLIALGGLSWALIVVRRQALCVKMQKMVVKSLFLGNITLPQQICC
jgi:hypothetical protein